MTREYIPADEFAAVLRRIAPDEPVRSLAARISAFSGTLIDSEERGLRRILDGEALSVGFELADRILTGLGHQEEFELLVPDYVSSASSLCEDCGKEIEPGVMPIDLFRRDPMAPHGRVWDSTKEKWVRRPRNARAGGRRFRRWNLCRKCRAEALRQRAHKADGSIRTKDRLPPKRGGRPRLLNEAELRCAYKVYVETGLSMNEIANRLHAARQTGTPSGYVQSLLYGWRKLGLKLRSRSAQVAISLHGRPVTWKPKQSRRCKVRLANGRRCSQWVRLSGNQPEEDGLCWNHAMQAKRREAA